MRGFFANARRVLNRRLVSGWMALRLSIQMPGRMLLRHRKKSSQGKVALGFAGHVLYLHLTLKNLGRFRN